MVLYKKTVVIWPEEEFIFYIYTQITQGGFWRLILIYLDWTKLISCNTSINKIKIKWMDSVFLQKKYILGDVVRTFKQILNLHTGK